MTYHYRGHVGLGAYSANSSPANTSGSTNVGLMLVQRLRRWTKIKPTLVERLVSAGSQWIWCVTHSSHQAQSLGISVYHSCITLCLLVTYIYAMSQIFKKSYFIENMKASWNEEDVRSHFDTVTLWYSITSVNLIHWCQSSYVEILLRVNG